MRNFLFLLSVSLFLISCGPSKVRKLSSHTSVVIKIVQINDVYEIAPLNGGQYGGLARVAHIRDSIKAAFPNTFLFLAGDFLNPSLLGTLKINGERLAGKQMIEVLNAMDVDLVTFGNHEFDLSEKQLQQRLNESTFDWTAANVEQVTEYGNQPFISIREGEVIPVSAFHSFTVEHQGQKVDFGVFGVTIASNPQPYVQYTDVYDRAVEMYDLAKKENDFVIGLTHVALAQDKEIARRITGIPLIMGGHEHFNMLVKEGNTIITKADANAKTVYVHTLTYDTQSGNLFVDSKLVSVNEHTGSSQEVEKVVDRWTEFLDTKLREVISNPDEIIFHASVPLDGTDTASRSKQTNLGEIIAKGMAHAYNGRVAGALVNGGSIRVDDMLSGDMTGTDIFRVLPFGGSVVRVELKGSLLKKVLDFGMEKAGTGAYLQRYNFLRGPSGYWQLDGQIIQDEKIYSVAFSDFLLKGLDIPFLTPDNEGIVRVYYPKDEEPAGDIRKAIIGYLRGRGR